MRFVLCLAALLFAIPAHAQGVQQTKGNFEDKFRQLIPGFVVSPSSWHIKDETKQNSNLHYYDLS